MFRLIQILLATLAIAVLTACTVVSPTKLIGPEEGDTPLPASFVVYGYKEAPDGYRRTEEAPISFALQGKAYVASDNSMSLQFVPLDNNGYLISVSGNEPGALYGAAWVRGQIVVIRMLLTDDLKIALKKARAASPPDVASDIEIAEGSIRITRRDTLDHIVSLMRKGEVPTSPVVAWIADNPDTSTPVRIIKDKDGWRAED